MRIDDCYQLGYISKTHGLNGEVQLYLDVDDPDSYRNLESVFVLQNKVLIPFFIKYIQPKGSKTLAQFDDIDSIDQATELVGAELYLPLSNLPKLPSGKYYYHELIGFDFYDGDNNLGKVSGVYNMTAQNLLVVDYRAQELLVPMTDEILKNVDTAQGKIIAELPDGLLELYAGDDEN